MNLIVDHLSITRAGKDILSDISFVCAPGELIVIRGKNGAGKSSLFAGIMGLLGVEIVSGDFRIGDMSYRSKKTHEIARAGIFLAHQEPPAIDGVTLGVVARAALEMMCGVTEIPEAQRRIRETLIELGLPEDFAHKTLHASMSGGEKKRAELFQLVLVKPKFALLDEIDSGLDATSCLIAASAITKLRLEGTGFVVVTHSDAFAEALNPTRVIELY
jgi:Fe-S cluster assembly ATP-binding protein